MPHRPRPVDESPVTNLSDLLPIHASVVKPNAYQVFGLRSGEQDAEAVDAAVQRIFDRLNETKATAEPDVWNQAAKLAAAARKVLEDPQRRRSLDESLGVTATSSNKTKSNPADNKRVDSNVTDREQAAVPEENDPLAGLLPTAKLPSTPSPGSSQPTATKPNSAAAVLGVTSGTVVNSVLGTPPLGTPPSPKPAVIQTGSTASDLQMVPEISPADAPRPGTALGWEPPKAKKKRRQKNTGVYLFGLFALVMIGAIAGLLKFLSDGGRIAVQPAGLSADDGIVVADPMPAPTNPRTVAPNNDGILRNVPASGIADSLRGGSMRGGDQDDTPTDDHGTADFTPPDESMDAPQVAMQIPDIPMTEPTPGPAPEPAPAMSPEPAPPPTATPEPSDAMVQANQMKVESVEQLIRSANWSEMKSAADGLLKLDLNQAQAERASTLFDIADLATFYRGAIGRGLATLKTGNSFEIVDDLPVIVVEVSPESLSIQYNRRTKTFTIDELPPRLTEKIASFALSPEQPDSIAGQALYRLIHPMTRDEYREDTLEVLASVESDLEKVDTAMLQTVVKELFSE